MRRVLLAAILACGHDGRRPAQQRHAVGLDAAQDLGAWELVARARTHVWRVNSDDNRAAIEALQREERTQ